MRIGTWGLFSKPTNSGQTRPVFFRFNTILGPIFSRVGFQDPKMGPIGSGWPQKGFKFGFNPILYLIDRIWTRPNPFLGRAIRVQNGSEFGSQGQNLGRVCQIHLAAKDSLTFSNQGGCRLCLPQKFVPTKVWQPPVRLKCALDQLGWSFVRVKKNT